MTQELPMPRDNVRFHPTAYRCIVADPPWDVKAGPNGGGYATGEKGMRKWNWRPGIHTPRDLDYPTMSVAEMCALPVCEIGKDQCHLFLWTINAYIEQAYQVARAWGFKPSTLLTWSKTPMGGGLGGTFGLCSEHILFATRGKVDARARINQNVFNWKRPYVDGKPRHSMKPPEFFRMAEKVSHGPYLELFARDRRDGWAAWGNTFENDIEITKL